MLIKTNYNNIASRYNDRYKQDTMSGVEIKIKQVVKDFSCQKILEIGCGTGRWLNALLDVVDSACGIDLSIEMLKICKAKQAIKLINSDAVSIPFINNQFDLIFCVNAIHHFSDVNLFLSEVKHVLKKDGLLMIIGIDPHIDKQWYIYKYFKEVYKRDIQRFIPFARLQKILEDKSFKKIEFDDVELINKEYFGKNVLSDPFLSKHNTSQLANLTDKDYEEGLSLIKNKVKENPQEKFITELKFYCLIASKN